MGDIGHLLNKVRKGLNSPPTKKVNYIFLRELFKTKSTKLQSLSEVGGADMDPVSETIFRIFNYFKHFGFILL